MNTLPHHASQGKTFIYGLIDPITQQIRYIGKSDNPERRFKQHIKYLTANTYKSNWIRGLLGQGLLPELVILEQCSKEIWQEREVYWIAYYREQGMPLTNGSDGGDGIINPTQEDRAKRSVNTHRIMSDPDEKARRMSSLHSPASIAKRIATKRDHPVTKTACLKISQARRKRVSPRKEGKSKRKTCLTSSRAAGGHLANNDRTSLKEVFLQKFRLSENVLVSCKEIGISRQSFYDWLKADADFKSQYEEIASKRKRKAGRHLSSSEREQAKETFLQVFGSTGNVRLASLKSGLSYETFYQWLRLDECFSQRYQQIRDACEGLNE